MALDNNYPGRTTYTTAFNWYFGVGLGLGFAPGYGFFITLPFVVITLEKD